MIRTSVIGASGYTGNELLKLLSSRDDIIIEHVIADSNAGKAVSSLYPEHFGVIDQNYELYSPSILDTADVIFLSLPHGESMKLMPVLHSLNCKIVDLGGDFRLTDPAHYPEYYKFQHLCPELLAQSVYGLTEINRSDIANARLIANPGCFPTSVLLALIPVLKHNIISKSNIVINSLSGVSGAGKKASLEYSYSELNENVQAYKINSHQHIPEIEQVLAVKTGQTPAFTFIPHLAPFNRGIYTTIVADLARPVTEQDIFRLFQEFYEGSHFIRLKKNIPKLKDVVNTNYCDIYFQTDLKTGKLVIISVLDNLLKGAAGQAVQNMNLMFGLPENLGLSKRINEYV